jgi:hypothetical protein
MWKKDVDESKARKSGLRIPSLWRVGANRKPVFVLAVIINHFDVPEGGPFLLLTYLAQLALSRPNFLAVLVGQT